MAFLLAAFGDVPAFAWERQARDTDATGNSRLTDWRDDDATVRLGVLTPTGGSVPVAKIGTMVAVVVGYAAIGVLEGPAALLDAYARAGVRGLASLHGEYAFAVWDGSNRSLFAGCDAVGLRAPAYTWNGRTFLLNTRAVALLGSHGPPAFDPVYAAHALSGIWAQTARATAFHRVSRMLGGELIRVSAQGLERFEGARLVFRPAVRREADAVRELAAALDGAIAADRSGPSCVAMSGGVDSCVVATGLAKEQPLLHVLSLVGPAGSPGDEALVAPVVAAFPGVRHNLIRLSGDTESLQPGPPSDDPVCAGPILQSGRATLLRFARELGFRRVFSGDGGDEVFDMAWRAGDLVRQVAIVRLLSIDSRSLARRVLRDFIVGGHGKVSDFLYLQLAKQVRAFRPWLRPEFWKAPPFALAWQEAVAFGRLPSARARLPDLLGSHGRYWRAQELLRVSAGVEASAPLVKQAVVELAGSLQAKIATDLHHSKVLLRRLAAQRVPATVAWRPKREPLSDWLIARWIAREANAAHVVSQIKASRLLAPLVDERRVAAAFDASQADQPWLGAALVELGAIAEWARGIETRFGL